MIKLLELQRGDTFQYIATWKGVKLDELKSEIFDYSMKKIADVTIYDLGNDNYRFLVKDTSNWPLEQTLYTIIHHTVNGLRESTETMTIKIVRY